MHQDIEKLLNVAKEKGSITEKQRSLIIAKAQQLNEDMTEIEFVLDDIPVKNNETQTPPPIPVQKQPKSNKQGEVKKCPQCGAVVQGYQGVCPECGYVFEGVQANQSVTKLMELLLEAENSKKSMWDGSYISKQQTIIKNFPIPNTKTDFIDFLTFLYPKTKDELDTFYDEYKSKYIECVHKAKLLFPDDKEISALLASFSPSNSSLDTKAESGGCMGVIAIVFVTGILSILLM